jgi:hypothetical protein
VTEPAGIEQQGQVPLDIELSTAEKIDRSYLCRVLRLTLLSPEIVEAIIDGRQPEWATLPALMRAFPANWKKQALNLGRP